MTSLEDNPRIDEATVVAVEKISLKELLASESSAVGKAKATFTWYQSTRVGRAMSRLSMASGFYLAGGIAYAALFSIFAALAIGWTIFMAVLGGNDQLRASVIDSVNTALPGMIDNGSNNGLVSPDSLVLDTALNLTSIIAFVVLLWSALAVMTALRTSIQKMFGIVGAPVSFVVGKLKDLSGFVVLALAVLVTSALGIAAGTLGTAILDWLGVEGAVAGFLLRAVSFLIAAAVDFAVFVFLFRFVAGMRVPKKDLVMGAGLAAIASSVLRVVGTAAVGSVSDNPVLAGATALVTLLLWVNLLARVTLLMAAFTANPPAPVTPDSPEEIRQNESPNYVTVSAPRTLNWDFQAMTGALNPDPSLNPDAEPKEPETPYWGGIIGAYKKWRIKRTEAKLAKMRRHYYHGE
ncbi:membrane protein [Bowdeniella nasicola]|uniref:Membrane protein n=1 Tax=Bowdeniella nasicola TaxID=208480 RepID=A0A1H3YZ80_9ACTO|nr:YihY/virulence factor BrkB family protein [Bowdeniella nasicola]SEA16730.1 membrane protein [Bowdeniella nasicola]